jgi:hypothetical protein
VATGFTLKDQGNRPKKLSTIRNPADLALVTDSQNSWDASLGLSFTYPGDGLWQDSTVYYNRYAYPHRTSAGEWAGSAAAMFDGSSRWTDFGDLIDLSAPYPHGAKWLMHYKRGIYEGAMFW